MGVLDLREQRHSKHGILQNQDLIIKNDYREKRKKIESYLMDLIDLRGQRHSKHGILQH
jgi:hypothetical protein